MAKQIGEHFIAGTIDDLCFYTMDGQYYVRMKSSLTRNRVRKSKAFANTMKSANELAAASVIASKIYRTIDKDKRKVALFRRMTGMAKLLLKNGESNEKIYEQLIKYIGSVFKKANAIVKHIHIKRQLFTYMNSNEVYDDCGTCVIKRKWNRRRRKKFW